MKRSILLTLLLCVAFSLSAQIRVFGITLFKPAQKFWWYKQTTTDTDVDADIGSAVCDSVYQKNQPSGGGWSKTRPVFVKVFDCNDNNSLINHSATDVCNGIDDNCNGLVDEQSLFITYWFDTDGDGYGDANNTVSACIQPDGAVTNSGDCNDNDATVHLPMPYFVDADVDGFGSYQVFICSSVAPFGYSLVGGDCNDTISGINPLAQESFNGIDDNCNGLIDEGFSLTKKEINGFCNELWQWDRSHTSIDVFSEPFNSNYLSLNPKSGTFNNAMANIHQPLPVGITGFGYNFDGCSPYPNSTAQCTNPSNCNGDGVGCYDQTFDFYEKTCQYYSSHNISLLVNINPYITTWNGQKWFIDVPIQKGVKIQGVLMGTELSNPTWYANSYYFPNGGSSYVTYFNKVADSIHRYYPSIPVFMWVANVWAQKGNDYNFDNAVTSTHADAIAIYGQTKDIVNRITVSSQNWTESQAADSVLSFSWWLNQWTNRVKTKFGNKKIALLTAGTNPVEPQIGESFMGLMQTEYEFMCFQFDTNIVQSQYYRTRSLFLQNNGTSLQTQIFSKRGKLYQDTTYQEQIQTYNQKIIGWKTVDYEGKECIEIINFSDTDYVITGDVEGWYVNNMLDSPTNSVYYTVVNTVKARSISFISNDITK